MKILVTGCGISGTFLLTRLMSAFNGIVEDNKVDHPKKIFQRNSLKQFVEIDDTDKTIIRKGNHGMLFCGILDEKAQESGFDYYKKRNVRVLNIIRNGRDVLQSKTIYPICFLWISCIDQYFKYQDCIACDIRFEELLQDPNEVQKKIGDTLGLTRRYNFSDYPRWIETPFTWAIKPSHKLRRLDASRVNKPIEEEMVQKVCGHRYNHFCELQEKLGYA